MEWATAGLIAMLVATIGLIMRLIATGRLVPRATLEDVRRDRDVRLAEIATERDYWRTASETRAAQVDKLLEGNETTEAFFRALKAGTDNP